jgi:anthranilate synthase
MMPDSQGSSPRISGLRVVRSEEPGSLQEFQRLVERIDHFPGMFYGSEYASDPVYERRSIVFSNPALRISLQGGHLGILPLNDEGRGILQAWSARHDGAWTAAGFVPSADPARAAHPVLAFLREFGAAFSGDLRSFGLYGAWSFDYWTLRDAGQKGQAAPRAVLYLPLQVLHRAGGQVTSLRYSLPDLPRPGAIAPASDAPGHGFQHRASEPASALDDFRPGQYAQRLEEAKRRTCGNGLVSMTLTQAFRRPFDAAPSQAFANLQARYPMPEMYFINLGDGEHLLGASPDIQARLRNGIAECMPVCGTSPRGKDALEDARRGQELLASAKEAAALALCSDAFAERMSEVCIPGSVILKARQRLHYFGPVIHAADCLEGRLAADRDAWDLLLATSAPPTVCGIPQNEALAAIDALEGSPRGWFGGAVGHIGFDGDMSVGTIMRMVWARGGVAEIRAGGVLTAQSVPEDEEAESRIKAGTLMQIAGLEGVMGPAAAGKPQATAAAPGHRPCTVEYLVDRQEPEAGLQALLQCCADQVRLITDPADASGGVLVAASAEAAKAILALTTVPGPLLLTCGATVEWLVRRGARARALPSRRDGHTTRSAAGSQPGWQGQDVMLSGNVAFIASELPPGLDPLMIDDAGHVLAIADRRDHTGGLLFKPQSLLTRNGRTLLARMLDILRMDAPDCGAT